jgi:hypothetical protein
MVVDDFNVLRSDECLESVAGGRAQIVERDGSVEHDEFAFGYCCRARWLMVDRAGWMMPSA